MSSWRSREELLSQIGRLSQVGGISPFVHAQGKAQGTSTLRVRTASGFEFWVVPDRGMDIYEASFQGQSLCWHSPNGVVHPAYASTRGSEWLKGFPGGLLTTCGLSTAGAPSQDGNESFGLHGSISNTPAENVSWSERWENDDCLFEITGRLRESAVHGPNLVLERTITSSLKSSSLEIRDVVENQWSREVPLMILYHCNFGFPLLTPQSRIYTRSESIEPVNDWSASALEQWNTFDEPHPGQEERVYYHRMKGEGEATVVLVSNQETRDYGMALRYDSDTLPWFNQWKMTSANHFVLGLEPGNCRTRGRAYEREQGTLDTLKPGERREFGLKISVLTDAKQVEEAIASVGEN